MKKSFFKFGPIIKLRHGFIYDYKHTKCLIDHYYFLGTMHNQDYTSCNFSITPTNISY